MTLPVPHYMQLVCSSSVDYLDCVQIVQEVWSSVERWRPEACRSPHWIPQAKASVSTSCTRNTSYPEAVVERFYFDHLDDFVNLFWWKKYLPKIRQIIVFRPKSLFRHLSSEPACSALQDNIYLYISNYMSASIDWHWWKVKKKILLERCRKTDKLTKVHKKWLFFQKWQKINKPAVTRENTN